MKDKKAMAGFEEGTEWRCANCGNECSDETERVAEIWGKYASKSVSDYLISGEDGNNEVKDKEDCPVTVLEALSIVYGYPLTQGLKQDVSLWRMEDDCVLCKQCANIMTTFYQAFQELQGLAHEASYIFKGLVQLHQCIKNAFLEDFSENGKNAGKDDDRGKSKTSRRNRRNSKKSTATSAISSGAPTIEKCEAEPLQEVDTDATDKVSGSGTNNDDKPFDLEIVKVESLQPEEVPRQIEKRDSKRSGRETPPKVEEEVTGTTEIISANGKIIRTSTRTRKIKAPVDFEENIPSSRSTKDVKGKRKDDGKISDEITAVLWEICDDIYYTEKDLKTLKNGRFLCPYAKCTKDFKGLKTLNKHALLHDLDRSYRCSKCDIVFINRHAIKLHAKQHVLPETSTDPKMVTKRLPNSKLSDQDITHTSVNPKSQTRRQAEIKIRKKYTKMSNNHQKTDQNKQFKCEHCDKSFLLKGVYERHLILHDKQSDLYRCTVCDQKFPTVLSLSRHITSVHEVNEKKELQYSCPKCPSSVPSFANYSELKLHFQTTHKDILNFCTICGKSFRTSNDLHSHYKSIHKMELPIIDSTQEVSTNIKMEQGLVEDLLQNGQMEPRPICENNDNTTRELFKCDQCDKTFKRKHQLNMHALFHNEKEPRFGCSQCPKKFFQPNALRTHMLVHTMENPLLCKQCGKVFERRDHFKKHMEVVHDQNRQKKKRKKGVEDESKNESHSCPECKKTFSRKEYLRLHTRIHTGEKPHVCEICGKQFRDPRNLVQHLVTHNTDRPFCCSVCGLTFKRAHHLSDHEGTHRQNVARPFVCTQCGKAFKLRKHLVSHELVHTGAKDHTCHVCGRAFSRKDNLRQHINKLHGKKLAEDLLVVVEEQRERYRHAQVEQQSSSITKGNESVALGNILKQAINDSDANHDMLSTSMEQETTYVVASSAGDLLTENGQMSEVLQIMPGNVVTTLAVPLSSIVTLASSSASSLTKFSYS